MTPDGLHDDPKPAKEKPAKPAKPRNRPSRAAEPTGPVHPREMTKIRDRVGDIRDKIADEARSLSDGDEVRTALERVHALAAQLWIDLDRLDLRFKIHQDPSVIAAQKKLAQGPG